MSSGVTITSCCNADVDAGSSAVFDESLLTFMVCPLAKTPLRYTTNGVFAWMLFQCSAAGRAVYST